MRRKRRPADLLRYTNSLSASLDSASGGSTNTHTPCPPPVPRQAMQCEPMQSDSWAPRQSPGTSSLSRRMSRSASPPSLYVRWHHFFFASSSGKEKTIFISISSLYNSSVVWDLREKPRRPHTYALEPINGLLKPIFCRSFSFAAFAAAAAFVLDHEPRASAAHFRCLSQGVPRCLHRSQLRQVYVHLCAERVQHCRCKFNLPNYHFLWHVFLSPLVAAL